MVNISNCASSDNISSYLERLLNHVNNLEGKELLINSNSGTRQIVFLDCIEKIEIWDDCVLFYGMNGNKDFLNLKNVLSISIGDELE